MTNEGIRLRDEPAPHVLLHEWGLTWRSPMHDHMSAEMQACMDACHHCHVTCLSMTTQHCLQVGGAHAAPDHIKIMLDCAQICGTSLDFMARGSDQHKLVCGICAQICRACAESCRGLDGMEECVAACERCVDACEKMAA